jgi:hypothetical protein
MVVGPEHKADVRVVVPDFRIFNALVGGPAGPGSISMLRLPQELRDQGFAAYCDDDAVARDQRPNAYAANLGHWRLLGPAVFFKDDDEGNEIGLTTADVRFLAHYLAGKPTAAAAAQAAADHAFWADHPTGMTFKSYATLEELFADIGLEP